MLHDTYDHYYADDYVDTDEDIISRVAEELARARNTWPAMASLHEAYAVILEEVDEFWKEVKRKPHKRVPSVVRGELIQIAAMAIRAAADLT